MRIKIELVALDSTWIKVHPNGTTGMKRFRKDILLLTCLFRFGTNWPSRHAAKILDCSTPSRIPRGCEVIHSSPLPSVHRSRTNLSARIIEQIAHAVKKTTKISRSVAYLDGTAARKLPMFWRNGIGASDFQKLDGVQILPDRGESRCATLLRKTCSAFGSGAQRAEWVRQS